jgi:type I restriction enzyme S subunit
VTSDTSSEWSAVRLGDVCSKIGSGATPRGGSNVYLSSGTSFLRSQNIHNARFVSSGLTYIGDEHAKQLSGAAVMENDVLLNITGDSVARSCLAPAHVLPARVSQHVAIMRPDPEILDPAFLNYVLISPSVQQRLLTLAGAGATRKALTKSMIEDMEIACPSVVEQRRIGGVLRSLDEKIEHNEKLLRGLDELLRLRCEVMLEGATERLALTDVARFVNGKAFTKHASGVGRPILRIKELNGGVSAGTLWADVNASPDNIAQPFDLLFSWSGSLEVYRWTGQEALINQHIFRVVPTNDFPIWLVEHFVRLHLDEFRAIAADKATTMGHIQRRHLDEAMVPVPSTHDLKSTRAELDDVDTLRAGLTAENQRLAALRDVLLPGLVTGAILVADAYTAGNSVNDEPAEAPSRPDGEIA